MSSLGFGNLYDHVFDVQCEQPLLLKAGEAAAGLLCPGQPIIADSKKYTGIPRGALQ